jgi:invasion protein IalB
MVCRASQSISMPQTQQLLVAVSVFKSAGGSGHSLSLQLPHGIYLPAGTNVQIDAEPAQTVVIEMCDQRGCYGGMAISEKMLAAMRKGKLLDVAFQNMSKSTVKVQLPLAGFPEAIKKL